MMVLDDIFGKYQEKAEMVDKEKSKKIEFMSSVMNYMDKKIDELKMELNNKTKEKMEIDNKIKEYEKEKKELHQN